MRRLSISLLIVVLLAIIGLGWAIDRLFASIEPNEADSLEVYRQLGHGIVTALDGTSALSHFVDSWKNQQTTQLRLIDRAELALPDELKKQLSLGQELTLESDVGITVYFDLPESRQVLAISPPFVADKIPLRFVLTILFYGGIVFLVLIWLFPLIRRLQALANAAKAFGGGQLQSRVTTHKRSYLHDIESEFNSMAGQIQNLVADNKLLSSAVSHDLRTPLARLRFGIDALAETTDQTLQATYLERISSDLNAMEQLVEVLLEYARLDQQLSGLPLASTSLEPIISASVEALLSSEDTLLEWLGCSTPSTILANERYVQMLVNNLLQNAVNHGYSRIRVSIQTGADRVWLIVEDDGQGIAVEA